jgi:dolichyl-phosphate-mannose--protein O-mannosyl transferase
MTPPEGIATGSRRTDRQLVGTVVAGVYVAVVALCFAYFFPIFVGHLITFQSWSARMWLGRRWI